jgi:tetratricopeptide (TPR) repeat protein
MAMRKEPERRYVAAAALAEDVRLHLEHFPIVARNDTIPYRVARFVRRNRRGVAAAALAAMALLTTSVVATWQARRARTEQATAERRLDESRQFAMSLLEDLFNSGEESLARLRERSGKQTVEYLDRLANEAGNEKRVQVDLAHAYLVLGNIVGDTVGPSQGDNFAALTNLRKAATMYEGLLAANSWDQKPARDLGLVYEMEGMVLLPTDVSASLEAHRRQLALFERICRQDPEDPINQFDLSVAVSLVAERQGHPYYGNIGDAAATLRGLRRSLELRDKALPRVPKSHQQFVNSFYLRADAHTLLAGILWATGELNEALEVQQRGISIYEALVADFPDHTSVRAEFGLAHVRFANLLFESGRKPDALNSLTKAAAVLEPLLSADPQNLTNQRDVARLDNQWGAVLLEQKPESALQFYRKAETIGENWLAGHPDHPEVRERLAESRSGIARALAKLGSSREADSKSREAVEIDDALVRLDPRNVHYAYSLVLAYRNRGDILLQTGNPGAASDAYRQALKIIEPMAASDPTSWLKRRTFAELQTRLDRLNR